MSTGWNSFRAGRMSNWIINLLGNEYWLELCLRGFVVVLHYKPTGK